jgi:predicted RNase H-like HicB family nuclease
VHRGNAPPRKRGLTLELAAVRYAVVIEKAGDNYSAYVPDLSGCIATGGAVAEVERRLRLAIHIDGLKQDGPPVLPPSAVAEYVEA